MQKRILIAATAALLSLPLAVHAADQNKKKGGFMAADTNNDGKVTVEEFVASQKDKMDEKAARAKFADLDKNKDGSLTREEFAAGAPKKDGEKKGKKQKEQ